MPDFSNELPPVKIFLSYVRADDQSFDIMRPFKESLQQLIPALSGRPAEVFLDRDDIPLGENWREKIESAVKYSYFFVPIYTGNYPRSSACREEFLLFQSAAAQRGAKSLIIPVIWFGLDSLLPEGEDDISDYVREHQAALFEEAWIQGPSSPPYKENIAKIAKRILSVAPEIDVALASAEEFEAGIDVDGRYAGETHLPDSIPTTEAPSSNSPPSEVDADDEEDGLLELLEAFETEFKGVGEAAYALTEAIQDLGKLPPAPEGNQLSSKEVSRYMIRAASIMKDPAKIIEDNGQRLFQATEKSDHILRRMIRITRSSGSHELIDGIHRSLAGNVESLEGVEEVVHQLEGLLTSMKTPEALSASVRRAVRPARRGIVAVQDSIRLMGEWRELVNTLEEEISKGSSR